MIVVVKLINETSAGKSIDDRIGVSEAVIGLLHLEFLRSILGCPQGVPLLLRL